MTRATEAHAGTTPTPDPDDLYPALAGLRVADAMHHGLISCSLETPLRVVARMMATYRVHAVLVTAHGDRKLSGGSPWGVVTDLDLLRAAEGRELDTPSHVVAATPVVMVTADHDLAHAARLMTEHAVSHLIVGEPRTGTPIGVVSTLDLARALAGFPERHPTDPHRAAATS
jgi:CBS domain-containing protein